MKKSILIIMILLIGSLSASAQWSSAGNDTGNSPSHDNSSKPAGGFIRVGGAISFNTLGGSYFENQSNVSGKTTGIISLCQAGAYFGKNKNFYAGLGMELPFKGWKEEVEINGRTVTTSYNTMGYRIPVFIGYTYRFTPKNQSVCADWYQFRFRFRRVLGVPSNTMERKKI